MDRNSPLLLLSLAAALTASSCDFGEDDGSEYQRGIWEGVLGEPLSTSSKGNGLGSDSPSYSNGLGSSAWGEPDSGLGNSAGGDSFGGPDVYVLTNICTKIFGLQCISPEYNVSMDDCIYAIGDLSLDYWCRDIWLACAATASSCIALQFCSVSHEFTCGYGYVSVEFTSEDDQEVEVNEVEIYLACEEYCEWLLEGYDASTADMAMCVGDCEMGYYYP
jgi:hypothetical protein